MGIEALFNFIHVSIIHFPIACFIIASALIIVMFAIKILNIPSKSQNNILLNQMELISWVSIVIGWVSFPLVAFFGLLDASSIQNVILTDLLAFKMQISFITFFIFVPPLYMKFFLLKRNKHNLVEDNLLFIF